MVARNWHSLGVAETLSSLNSRLEGLSQAEAQRRLAQFGPNELVEKRGISPWAIFLEQFQNLLIIILLVAVALSAALDEVADAVVIAAIVLFATFLGFIQEYRAERSLAALKRMAAPTASVLRDGKEIEISARELVPGDIILIRTGDRIPADSRLIMAINLKVGEAPLTGESVPVEKNDESVPSEANIGDRRSMVFTGAQVVYGRGTAIVTATGMATEFGKIAGLLQEVKKEPTPLQVSLDQMGKWIAIGALALCFILAGLGVLRGHPILEMLIWGVSLAVAAVPEALPAVVTISLALGVKRMVRRHALVRRLPSVETLGSTTVICSDKTGTLTQDQMTVRRIYVDGRQIDVSGVGYEPSGEFAVNGAAFPPTQSPSLMTLLNISSLCVDSSLTTEDGVWGIKGDPTEGALVVAAAKAGIWQKDLSSQFPRLGEIPFSSESKRMTTVHQLPKGKVAYSKGAPEVILNSCRYIFTSGEERELTEKDREKILSVAQAMAGDALRVLGLSYKNLSQATAVNEDIEQDMVFVGLSGLIDPPREEVKDAVELCYQAGIKTVMMTGDHKLTAVAIARELGILKEGMSLTGAELDQISDKEFETLVAKIEVYARVSPAHKLRVVEALSKRGHVVAMTGDGVNDAPALKEADIGIAMGITGTDVTKEAADMVLTDDSFASIVAAVEEGRGIYDNVKKYLMYLLSSNLGEILLMAIGILFGSFFGTGGALPLIATQILWVNLATDGLPAIALAVDPAAPDIMKRHPRPRTETVFTRPVVALIALGGVWSAVINLGIFSWALGDGKSLIEAQALVFMTLIVMQFFKAFNYRSDRLSIFRLGMLSNKWLIWAVLASLGMTLPLLYIPFLQEAFHTYPLNMVDWAIVVLSSASIFLILEVGKLVIRRLSPPVALPPQNQVKSTYE